MQVQKVRTTTYLPADLMELAKAEALASKTSVSELMIRGLQYVVGQSKKSNKVKWSVDDSPVLVKKITRAMAYE